MIQAHDLLTWVHVLSMVGAFGGLLFVQMAIPLQTRNEPALAGDTSRTLNILLVTGLLAGLANYVMVAGWERGAHYNGVIGSKFVILLIVGGLLAMSKKPGRGDTFRWISLALLALAALFGKSIA